jgi:hypothetical protein
MDSLATGDANICPVSDTFSIYVNWYDIFLLPHSKLLQRLPIR